MVERFRRVGCVLAGVALLAVSLGGQTRLETAAPILDFSLPRFTPEGWLEWRLDGDRALYLSAREIALEQLVITLYQAGPEGEARGVLTSDEATVDLETREATGGGSIRYEAPGYLLTGSDWTWDGATETITVRENARVVFADDLRYLLE